MQQIRYMDKLVDELARAQDGVDPSQLVTLGSAGATLSGQLSSSSRLGVLSRPAEGWSVDRWRRGGS